MSTELRQRGAQQDPTAIPGPNLAAAGAAAGSLAGDAHPSGKEKHGRLMQVLRGLSFGVWFLSCCVA